MDKRNVMDGVGIIKKIDCESQGPKSSGASYSHSSCKETCIDSIRLCYNAGQSDVAQEPGGSQERANSPN